MLMFSQFQSASEQPSPRVPEKILEFLKECLPAVQSMDHSQERIQDLDFPVFGHFEWELRSSWGILCNPW